MPTPGEFDGSCQAFAGHWAPATEPLPPRLGSQVEVEDRRVGVEEASIPAPAKAESLQAAESPSSLTGMGTDVGPRVF